jgi:DNA replication protein DnaC
VLVLEDLSMRCVPATAAEDLFEAFIRRYEKASIIVTSNRPLEDWGQVLGDTAAARAILDRFLHHAGIVRRHGTSCRMHDRKELPKGNQNNPALTHRQGEILYRPPTDWPLLT